MDSPIVIAGASLAGLSTARELRKQGYQGVIQLVDPDEHAPYRRPSLSKGIITGKQQPDDIRMAWPDELSLERVSGTALTGLDVAAQVVHGVAPGGAPVAFPYAHLVIATGATARSVSFAGPCHDIVTIRSLSEGAAASSRLAESQRLVIIGAGFIGLEVAAAARSIGRDVTVVEVAPVPLAHAVGATMGEHLAGIHRSRGVEILCGVGVREIQGEGHATGVVLEDGRVLAADLVVAAVGSLPNVGWLAGSGLDISAGVVCDHRCVPIGAANIVAAGDAVSWFNPLYGRQMRVEHWTNAIEQGGFAARQIMGVASPAGFSSAPYFWSEQFDLRIQSVGSTLGHDAVVELERDGDKLVVAYGREGSLMAVAGVNSGAILPKYRRLIEQRVPLTALDS
jgi:3-phenylpropionate/trans-cinnamate dioxygenase ferredoxin reductase component